MQKPLIFLAFSNDRTDEGRYLRNLPEEQRLIIEALETARTSGYCEYIHRSNTTASDIFSVFQNPDYRDRIAVFHFGGHANDYQLLFESSTGKAEAASASGLAAFLGQQRGLQLVFLNGCSTRGQVDELLKSNTSAVIATSQAIDDQVAMSFASLFYRSLAGGVGIERAYKEAESAVKTTKGDNLRNAYLPGQEALSEDRWPWELIVKDGAEIVKQWNLPDFVGNPLGPLGELPHQDLPDKPFRDLHWFTRKEAEIFFGRGREIRELYDRVTGPDTAPILLLYGQSGVGKSSILEAGLIPRLETDYAICYLRRDKESGLLGTLSQAFLPEDCKESIERAWIAAEARLRKPLVVIIDQVEEVYTRPYEKQANEMSRFFETLERIFTAPTSRPRGKLVLCFRKEWVPEIKQELKDRRLPRADVFLARLDRKGIIESVSGITRSDRLRNHYSLSLEESLAEIIADDLLEDSGSPVAPTLQILLTKMWDRATSENNAHPKFAMKLYQALKSEGILLGDFLDQQLAKVKETNSEYVESGLALDVLKFHTTDLGTAAQHTPEELNQEYRHRGALPALVHQFKDLYLLVDPSADRPSEATATRLAHDTLAPLVRERFDKSMAPGQRARRVLENRSVEWRDSQRGTPLDENDLRTVERGASGMRESRDDERSLIEASRHDRRRRETRRRTLIAVGAAAILLIVISSIAAWAMARRAKEGERSTRQLLHSANLGLMKTALDKEDYSQFYTLLEQSIPEPPTGPDEVRSFSWYYFWRLYHQKWPMFNGHTKWVTSVNFSPDGKTLASGSLDDTIRLWDVASRHEIAMLSGHTSLVDSVSFSPDGKTLASASMDKTIKLWDVTARREIATLSGHTGWVTSVSFSPDGKTLASVGDYTIKLWDVAGHREIATLSGHALSVNSVSFSPDGKTLASAAGKTIKLWDVDARRELATLSGHASSVNSVTFSPDGNTLASGSEDKTIKLWDVAGRRETATFSGHTDNVLSVSFSPDGKTLASGSVDKMIKLWDVIGRREIATLSGHGEDVTSVSFSPDGKTLASGSHDKMIRLWHLAAGEIDTLKGHGENVTSLSFSPNGKTLASASEDNTIKLWDMDARREMATLSGHTERVTSVSFSPDGKILASASTDDTIRLWDVAGRREIATLPGDTEGVISISFSADGKTLASGSDDKTIKLWDLAARREIATLSGHTEGVISISLSPDGKTLASGSEDNTIKLWDVAARREIATLSGHTNAVLSVSFSPDSKMLASGSDDNTIKLWDVAGRREIATLSGHTEGVFSVIFSPDGKTLASGSMDKMIKLWDVTGRREIATLSGHTEDVTSLSFSPDGKTLASGSRDKTIRLYFAATDEDVARQRNKR